MKAPYLVVILLLLLPAFGGRAGTIAGRSVKTHPSVIASWPEECEVNVYFVENMFTAGEKQLLWNAIETWTRGAKKKGFQITFVLAGETGGLIDCVGCLTIARQGLSTNGTRQRVSFNTLRQDHKGRLISAWIGFERATVTETELRTLMLQTLERGFAMSSLQTASSPTLVKK